MVVWFDRALTWLSELCGSLISFWKGLWGAGWQPLMFVLFFIKCSYYFLIGVLTRCLWKCLNEDNFWIGNFMLTFVLQLNVIVSIFVLVWITDLLLKSYLVENQDNIFALSSFYSLMTYCWKIGLIIALLVPWDFQSVPWSTGFIWFCHFKM